MSTSFVLVEWIGDPKPDCWEIIKSDKFLKPMELKDGAVLDAHWKPEEEPSPAKVLKVHGKSNFSIWKFGNSD